MKLMIIGCLHGSAPKKIINAIKRERPSAILCSGDLCDSEKLRDLEFGNWNDPEILEAVFSQKKYLRLVKESAKSMAIPLKMFEDAKIPVFLVYGNNDFLDSGLKKLRVRGLESRIPSNVSLLKDEVIEFCGIYIAGFPGYRGLNSKNIKSHNMKFENRMQRLLNKIKYPEKTFFLTHDVPYKIFDKVTWKKSPAYNKHVGEKIFNKLIRKKYLGFLCSHIHESQGLDILNSTSVIVSGYGKESQFVIINIESGKLKKVKFFK